MNTVMTLIIAFVVIVLHVCCVTEALNFGI